MCGHVPERTTTRIQKEPGNEFKGRARVAEIDLIIFDMDGTLYKYENGADDLSKTRMFKEVCRNGVEFVASKLSIPEASADGIINDIRAKYKNEIGLGLNAEYGIVPEEFLNAAWNVDPSKYVDYDTGLRGFLLSLQHKKAILTAAPKVWAERLLRYMDVYDVFDGIWAREGKLRKPDPEVYRTLLRHFDVEPSRAMMVEDNDKLLRQPKELGMRTVLISRDSPSSKSGSADFVVCNIKDIARIPELIKIKG